MFNTQIQKSFSLSLIGALLFVMLGVPVGATTINSENKEAARVTKIKDSIAKFGTGPDAKIKVKLHDKTKLSGYVSEIKAESFVITEDKTGTTKEVTYPDVAQAKGKNLSTGAAIAIGIGIGVGATILTLFILAYALAD